MKWFMPMIEAYGGTLLQMAGGVSPRLSFDVPAVDGERMGIETVTTRLHLSWR